jgi:hypothetical protein
MNENALDQFITNLEGEEEDAYLDSGNLLSISD